jgi:arylsulfatase A-like enzyme
MRVTVMRPTQALAGKLLLAVGLFTAQFMAPAAVLATSAGQPPAMAAPRAPAGAPNVVVVLLDDVGFGAASTFGGPALTPTLDSLAANGLRYNRFHTTAICSPTRAALLTGRDAHAANVGAVINSSNQWPGYQGRLQPQTATIAEVLRQNGYSTAAFGKWHLIPNDEASPIGPFDRWPVGLGFEKFYGFLGGETDQYEPTLYEGTAPVHRPAGGNYHLNEDLAEQAVRWMQLQKSIAPQRPFFLYFATGATHAPLQVPRPWIDRYQGQFEQGWDALREETFARQIALGVVPADAELTPRHEQIPAWDSLGSEQQRVATRLMETFAGFLTHTDENIGRIVTTLKELDQFENTLFIYIVGDNGASSEGGLAGSVNYMGPLQGLPEPLEHQLSRLDAIGGADTFPQYPAGWAWATNTPFPWVKQVASHLGGTRNPLVVSWPRGIEERGGVRSQFSHVNDITPTILDAVGLEMPKRVRGVDQLPLDGSSLLPSFASAEAPEHKRTQYFEVHGNRAIYHGGWLASARHSTLPWTVGVPVRATPFADDVWELYHLDEDFSQARNLAAQYPDKLAELQDVFMQEAERVGILPLRNALVEMRRFPPPSLRDDRVNFTFHEGAVGIPEHGAPPMNNRSWRLRATLEISKERPGPEGVIATIGGTVSGWSLYLNEAGRPVFEYRIFEAGQIRIEGSRPLGTGEHQLAVSFDYDGGGFARGGVFTLRAGDQILGEARVPATPPAYFSIDETFDIGVDTGSPAGAYPAAAAVGYPLHNARIEQVEIELL